MKKLSFKERLIKYKTLFEDSLDSDAISINRQINYSINVINNLKYSFLKENKMDSCYSFIKNIDVMKSNLLDTNFENANEVVEEMIDNINFLQRRYVK